MRRWLTSFSPTSPWLHIICSNSSKISTSRSYATLAYPSSISRARTQQQQQQQPQTKSFVEEATVAIAEHEKAQLVLLALHNYELAPDDAEAARTLNDVLRTYGNHVALGSVLEGRDLRGVDLRGVRLGVSVSRALFEGASLEAASAKAASFERAVLRGTSLASTDFADCDFSGCALVRCDLRNARFRGCRFDQATVASCDLRGAAFHGCSFECARMDQNVCDNTTFIVEPEHWATCRVSGAKGKPVVRRAVLPEHKQHWVR
eukprot:PhM_4_TR12459/c0_g1_i1/m.26494